MIQCPGIIGIRNRVSKIFNTYRLVRRYQEKRFESLLKEVTCYSSSQHEKERVGSQNDGGYVILKGLEYDCFISCGVGENIEFENQILEQNPNLFGKTYIYDGTVNGTPGNKLDKYFYRKNISPKETQTTSNLKSVISKNKNILLKMDIEGAEWEWFKSVTSKELGHVKQMVVEFHGVTTLKKLKLIKKINKTHFLIHCHANNADLTLVQVANLKIPQLLELTFIRKNEVKSLKKNTDPIPTNLDQRNVLDNPEISLNYWPFIHSKCSEMLRT